MAWKHKAPKINYKYIIHRKNIHDDQARAPSKVHAFNLHKKADATIKQYHGKTNK